MNNEGLSTNSHILVNVSRVEIQDLKNTFENIEVRIHLDSFNETVKYSRKENQDFIFDKNLKM